MQRDDDLAAFNELVGQAGVQRWFEENDAQLLAQWQGPKDPLLGAISHSLEEVEATNEVADLSQHAKDIQSALPGNPRQAIGATKDLLELAMRTILSNHGIKGAEALDFPGLAGRCFGELELTDNTPPNSEAEGKIRRIAARAKDIVITANELRNIAGSGHGRAVGAEQKVDADDASMVASLGMILTAWLMRKSAK